jgi:hypothetical protein
MFKASRTKIAKLGKGYRNGKNAWHTRLRIMSFLKNKIFMYSFDASHYTKHVHSPMYRNKAQSGLMLPETYSSQTVDAEDYA